MQANLPLSIGFINIPTFLIFVPVTTFMARIGANTAHKIDKTKLQKLFGIFLYVIGTIFLYRYLNIIIKFFDRTLQFFQSFSASCQ